jgi:ATP-dependent exoDNAse (exonuclease V) beta subunit
MKQRVLSYLRKLSSFNKLPSVSNQQFPKNDKLIDELSKSLSLSQEVISARAGIILSSILHNYSEFTICTIDSFVHRIIKTFAHDLYIPVNFDVELDSDKLLAEAVDILISRAGTDENLTKILVEFTESRTDDERSWHIENDILKLAFSILSEDGQIGLDKLKCLSIDDFYSVMNKSRNILSRFEVNISQIGSKAVKLIAGKNISNTSFFQGEKGIGTYFANLANGSFDKIYPNSYVLKAINEDKWTSGKADKSQKYAVESVKDELKALFLLIDDLIRNDYGKYILLKLILQNSYPVAVLNEIKKIIDTIKEQNNILHISEFNKIISGIVLSEPIPFIYERTGEKFKHYLIDEFQDTSVLQWQNLLPLIDNSIANGNFNLLVGDAKQAIYRWRNGDAGQFMNLPYISQVPGLASYGEHSNAAPYIKEREMTLVRNYGCQPLDTNHRSKKIIVDFNNSLFSFIAKKLKEPFSKAYENVSQKSKFKLDRGFVQIEFLNSESHADNKISNPLQNHDSASVSSFEELNLIRVEDIIRHLLNRNFRLRDIAVLCRSNENAAFIAQHLLSVGIDVVSSESLLLKNSPAVNFLISCMKFITSPDDNIAKAQIENFLSPSSDLRPLSSNFKSYTIYDLTENLIRIFGLNISRNVNPALIFFLDSVNDYSLKISNNVSDFLEWWEEKKDSLSIIVPEGLDAVRIMSIHKAKGLQFPVVIYPFAKEKFRNTKDFLWLDIDENELPELKAALVKNSADLQETNYKELFDSESSKSYLDLVNILYVVLTRAEDRIYVLSKMPGDNTEAMMSVNDMLAEFLKNSGKWNDSQCTYTFGKDEDYELASDIADYAAESLDTLRSSNWREALLIRTEAPASTPDTNEVNKRKFGELVHLALSRITFADEVEVVLNQLVINEIAVAAEYDKLREIIIKVVSNPSVKKFFRRNNGFEIKAEAELLTVNDKVFRPDRVMLKDNKAVIIEFKTGKEDDSHIKQIENYSDILCLLGYEVTEKYIVYPEENIVRIIS